MGYSHYWYPYGLVEGRYFKRIRRDFRTLLILESRLFKPVLFGADGTGAPSITGTHISFNGERHCGHQSRRSILFCFPWCEDRSSTYSLSRLGIEESRIRACSGGMCSCEAMALFSDSDREGAEFYLGADDLFTGSVKTNFKPYDIAVQCLLIVAWRRVPGFIAESDGLQEHWFSAMLLCQMNLGYGLAFRLGKTCSRVDE